MNKEISSISLLLLFTFYILTPQPTLAKVFVFVLDGQTPQIGGLYNTEGRKQYAKNLINFFIKIDNCVPTLSPSQKNWLEHELKEYERTKNLIRYFEIIKNKEYLLNHVKKDTELIIQTLNLITKTDQIKREVYFWSSIVVSLVNDEYWLDMISLVKIGIVDKNIFSLTIDNLDTFYSNNGKIPAIQIMKYVIQPYLDGKLLE